MEKNSGDVVASAAPNVTFLYVPAKGEEMCGSMVQSR